MKTACQIIVFILMISASLIGQGTIKTASGQYVKINNDGTYQIIDSLQVETLSPFEMPKSTRNIEFDEKILTNDLLNQLKVKEVTLAVKNRLLLEQILSKKGEVEQAVVVENKFLQDSFSLELSMLEKENLVIQESYTSISADIKKMILLSNETDISLRKSVFEELSKKYSIEVKDFKTFNPQLTNRTDIEKDDRKPWEINVECNGVDRSIVNNMVNFSTKAELIFSFTPARLSNYYKGIDFLICEGGIVKINGAYFIDLQFRFESKDAKKGYGRINKNSFLRLEMLSGKRVFMNAVATSEGTLENYSGNTVYNVRYEFSNNFDFRSVKRNFIDKIGVLWSSGFEEYPIYNIDFFRKKIDCIEHEN